mgnify:CR=1 FL=1|jgi:uncharacterized protein (DUF2342 family)
MTGNQELSGQEWAGLVEKEERERESAMVQRYQELATLPDEELDAQMREMASSEYDLPDQELRDFTVSRLRAWLDLEIDTARKMADSYNRVMETLPGGKAIRQVSMEQTLARAFSPEDQALLVEMEPGIFGAVAFAARLAKVDMDTQQALQEPAKRRWWPFGKG